MRNVVCSALTLLLFCLFVGCASTSSGEKPQLVDHNAVVEEKSTASASAVKEGNSKQLTIEAPADCSVDLRYYGPESGKIITKTVAAGTSMTIVPYIYSETLAEHPKSLVRITVSDPDAILGYYLKSDDKNVYVFGSMEKGTDHLEGLYTYMYAPVSAKAETVTLRLEKAKEVVITAESSGTVLKGYQYIQPCTYIAGQRWIMSYTKGTEPKTVYYRPDIYQNIIPKQDANKKCVIMYTKDTGKSIDDKASYSWSDGKKGDSSPYKRTFDYDKLPESLSTSVK